MNRKKLLLIIQSALCVALAAMLIAAAVGVFLEGEARRAESPTAPIYTRERAAQALRPAVPVLCAALATTAVGRIMGVRGKDAPGPRRRETDSRSEEPAADEKRIRIVRALVFAAAVLLLLAGIRNGGARDVLGKAARICTECVGLG